MVFTSQLFTFICFPLLLIAYFSSYFLQEHISLLRRIRATDLVLIAFSLAFYMWACFDHILVFLAYILAVYAMGRFIQLMRNRTGNTFVVVLFCAFLIAVLVYYKAPNLVARIRNCFSSDNAAPKSVIALLGISFISFSAISYLVDIYRNKAEAGNLIDCMLYLSFFVKVVSGPIVLWQDFHKQKANVTLDKFHKGMNRMMIGYAKKVILADSFGACIAKMDWRIDAPIAWGMALAYMLQLYFDFSGYSDIAIGIANMLGFEFEENFNFPYLSTSITDFWRRWHISLGRWFREYIYFPLGGSRHGTARTVVNIAIVFLLTGIWHGSGWTYLLWGAINGICNIIEKLIGQWNIYKKTPKVIKWFLTMCVTFVCWQLFRASSVPGMLNYFKIMFGMSDTTGMRFTWSYYFDTQMIVFFVIGILGSTVFGLPKVQQLYRKGQETVVGFLINQITILALFVVAILFMVNSTYSPFIYFQY